jgi:hypothetical protein
MPTKRKPLPRLPARCVGPIRGPAAAWAGRLGLAHTAAQGVRDRRRPGAGRTRIPGGALVARLPLVYIIGPFRAPTHWGVCQNIRRAEELALRVAEMGAMPLCPHLNTANFHGLLTDDFWLAGTAELLRRCDAGITVPGWQNSEGSEAEVELARNEEIPIAHTEAELAWWMARWIEGQARELADTAERMKP